VIQLELHWVLWAIVHIALPSGISWTGLDCVIWGPASPHPNLRQMAEDDVALLTLLSPIADEAGLRRLLVDGQFDSTASEPFRHLATTRQVHLHPG
jgi:hypothetical protein